jgi:hypothetical protein
MSPLLRHAKGWYAACWKPLGPLLTGTLSLPPMETILCVQLSSLWDSSASRSWV